jgi:hypothetical protein
VKIRWARGFLRAWLVFAALWVIGWGIAALTDGSIPSLTHSCEELRSFVADKTAKPLGDVEVAQCEAVWRIERLSLLKSTFVLPILLLVGGTLLAWIIRGFRSERPNPNS